MIRAGKTNNCCEFVLFFVFLFCFVLNSIPVVRAREASSFGVSFNKKEGFGTDDSSTLSLSLKLCLKPVLNWANC